MKSFGEARREVQQTSEGALRLADRGERQPFVAFEAELVDSTPGPGEGSGSLCLARTAPHGDGVEVATVGVAIFSRDRETGG